MNCVCRVVVSAALAAVVTAPPAAAGQQPTPQQQTPAEQKTDPKQDPKQDPKNPQKPEDPRFEETVVVSASKTEEKLVNAPATMSVIGGALVANATSQNFAELLRTVPGVNITQVSARDINITSRGATGTLATGQLALLDGRSIYQDFFGFVMWDFLPVNFSEIKQIEVIRGPASAVWGANALYGVVNVITKSPREIQGTSATLGLGTFERKGQDAGALWYVSGTHAAAVNDRWSYKLSGGGYSQDPLTRPTGAIPCTMPNVCAGSRVSYPGYSNTGTTQPKFDARVDYDFEDGRTLTMAGGATGTEGIMHSGIGPFDINSGSVMSYAKVNFARKGLRAGFFTNILDGDAANLLSRDPQGRPIGFAFNTKTFDFELSNVQSFASRHVVSYGGNLRLNRFDLSIAPQADDRTEFGVYAQDEIFLSEMFRWVIGGRVDRFDYIDDFVFSPRTTFMIKPVPDHTFRLSYNRAYRAPSVINNFLDIDIAEPAQLPTGLYLLPIRARGNEDLKEQSLDAYEIGYTGVIGGRTVLSASWYLNKLKDDILFSEDRTGRWTHLNPPPGWPLPPGAIFLITQGQGFPGRFTYVNSGKTTQKGLELGVDTSINRYLSLFANYSWQGEPDPEDVPLTEINIPAKHRFNTGFSFNYSRFLGNLSVSYSDEAFWQDVLDARYAGTTEPYTLVNAGFGVKWAGDRLTTTIKATNLMNDDVQQHVFGDILKRQIVGELRIQLR